MDYLKKACLMFVPLGRRGSFEPFNDLLARPWIGRHNTLLYTPRLDFLEYPLYDSIICFIIKFQFDIRLTAV